MSDSEVGSHSKCLEEGKHEVADDRTDPEWVKNLSAYFQVTDRFEKPVKDGHKTRHRRYFTMKCVLCKPKPVKKRGNKLKPKLEPEPVDVTGNSQSTFLRHLESLHQEEFAKLQASSSSGKTRKSSDDAESVVPSVIGKTGNATSTATQSLQKYDMNSTKQQVFNKHVLDFITLDGLPFSISERVGFKQLISSLDSKLNCPSRRTICRMLYKNNDKIIQHLKSTLNGLLPGSAHLILDIWSSRQRYSVIGIQVRYIKDWRIHQKVLGFKHFPGSHDANNIKIIIQDLLKNVYGLTISDFLTVTADNASAILLAFKDPNASCATSTPTPFETETVIEELADDADNEPDIARETDDLLQGFYFEEEEEFSPPVDTNDRDDEVDDSGIMSAIDSVIRDWSLMSTNSIQIRRNSCLAHLLQLGIKDALANKDVSALMRKVNSIITWYNKSNKQYTALRELTGIGLVKPCETRWNSTHDCLKRLIKPVNITIGTENKLEQSVGVLVNKSLTDARKTNKKVPSGYSEEDLAFIKVIVELLEPFAVLTDMWQADHGVTSSSVIIGLVEAIEALDDVNVEDGSDVEASILRFKGELRKLIVQRFETNKDAGQKVVDDEKRERRIVTLDVFNDKFYLLATVLDPRMKTLPFEDSYVTGLNLKNGYPSKTAVLNILKEAFKQEEILMKSPDVEVILESQPLSHSDLEIGSSTSQRSTASSDEGPTEPPLKKKKRDMFSKIQFLQSKLEVKAKVSDEIEQYTNSLTIPKNEDPLRFWRINEERFPVLSRLAKKYLSFPASSASVERLFSVAGAIICARRSCIKIKTAEQLIMYKEYLKDGL